MFGSLVPRTDAGYTAWANYTIGGNYTAGNLTSTQNVITDYPLFVSGQLDPQKQYNLTVEIAASADAPYLLDYVLAYHATDSSPIFTTTSSSMSSASATATAAPSGVLGGIDFKNKFIYVAAGLGAGVVLLSLLVLCLCKRLCCPSGRKRKSVGTCDRAQSLPMLLLTSPSDYEASTSPEPEPALASHPQKSATLVSAKSTVTRRGMSESVSSSSIPPEASRAPSPAPARTLSASQVQAAVPVPTPASFAPTSAPSMAGVGAFGQAEFPQPTTPAFNRTGSMPYLELPSGMSSPSSVPHVDPFSTPAAEVPGPMPVLYNPYDTMTPVSASSSARPLMTRSGSVLSTPSEMPTSASVVSTPSVMPPSSIASMPSTSPSSVPVRSNALVAAATTAPAPVAATEPGPSSPAPMTVLGPDEYPKEKQEVRLEPPSHKQQQLFALNADVHGGSAADPWAGSSDSPPAYGA